MKNHHAYTKSYIGSSDFAALTLRSCDKVGSLDFFEDGSYSAYIVDGDCAIPDSYKIEFEGAHWLCIYDDTSLTAEFRGDHINIYRRGDYGCIIQIINDTKEGENK